MVTAAFDLVIEGIEKMSDKFDLDDSITEKLDEVVLTLTTSKAKPSEGILVTLFFQ